MLVDAETVVAHYGRKLLAANVVLHRIQPLIVFALKNDIYFTNFDLTNFEIYFSETTNWPLTG